MTIPALRQDMDGILALTATATKHDLALRHLCQAARASSQVSIICTIIGAGVFGVVDAILANIPVVGFVWFARWASRQFDSPLALQAHPWPLAVDKFHASLL
jgi:hypothetical protein